MRFLLPLFLAIILVLSGCAPVRTNDSSFEPERKPQPPSSSHNEENGKHCEFPDCGYHVNNTRYCSIHTCRFSGCGAPVSENLQYCTEHSYLAELDCFSKDGCAKTRVWGSVFCADHKAEHESTLNTLLTGAEVEYDAATDTHWYYPDNRPKKAANNTVFSYVGYKKGDAPFLKLVMHYSNDAWILIDSVTFNIDGKKLSFSIPQNDVSRNKGGGKFWEHAEIFPDSEQEKMLRRMTDAKRVTVTYKGDNSQTVRTLFPEELSGIKQIINLYDEMLLK